MLRLVAALVVGLVVLPATLVVMTPKSASAVAYVVTAEWVDGPSGTALSITPTGVAQSIGITAASAMWSSALSKVPFRPYSPEVYASMFQQLQCHLFFRLKTPYNVDTWRPSVSWATELRMWCNPEPGQH